jgi:ABC-type uncharacterized transport system, permease component
MNIFKRLLYYLEVGRYSIKLEIQRQMEYPSFLFGWLIANPTHFVLGLVSIKIVIANFGSLNGWNFNEVAFLYGIASMSHGLTTVVFIQTWYIQYLVTEGEFDRFLLRPLNIFFQFSVMDFNLIGFTDLLPAVCILIYGCRLVGFKPTFINLIMLIAAIVGATLIRGALYLATCSLAFWTKRSPFADLDSKIIYYTSRYPLTIYPNIFQILFTYIIPLGFVSFYPASAFLHKGTSIPLYGNMCFISLLMGIVMYTIGYMIFKSGLSRYESSGS